MPAPFNKVEANFPPRSLFDLSHEKKLTCDMVQLVPILNIECVPGDSFKIGNEIVIRMPPMLAPVLHEINAFVHYFFVPYRILWDQWETFITGGADGEDDTALPLWIPSSASGTAEGTCWDFMGYPTVSSLPDSANPDSFYPVDFCRRAYIKIFNDFYRDENLAAEQPLNYDLTTPFSRAWEKDYFTSALPWQQRGIAPALPISGVTSAVWPSSSFTINSEPDNNNQVGVNFVASDGRFQAYNAQALTNLRNALNGNTVDLSVASTFDIADLRMAFQLQRWLERNARAGVRYTEFLKSHFGVHPRDDRLQRPEYIGGSKSPIIISEVLQTSNSSPDDEHSPQGTMAGHGLTADRNYITNYNVKEYGVLMGIMSVMPRTSYQQGINRTWLRRTRYDYYFPEFANLSEQEIRIAELYWTDQEEDNAEIFGYQGRYDEMRYIPNTVHGLFRSDLSFWHLGRIFSSKPVLNSSFIRGSSAATKRIFAVETEPGLMVSFGNIIRAVRPLPAFNTPGLIDHG